MKKTKETITLKKVLAEEGEDAFGDPCYYCALDDNNCGMDCGPDEALLESYFVFEN